MTRTHHNKEPLQGCDLLLGPLENRATRSRVQRVVIQSLRPRHDQKTVAQKAASGLLGTHLVKDGLHDVWNYKGDRKGRIYMIDHHDDHTGIDVTIAISIGRPGDQDKGCGSENSSP